MLIQQNNYKQMRYALILFLLLSSVQSIPPSLLLANIEILKENEDPRIYFEGVLSNDYDDTTFNEALSCRNGNLVVIDSSRGDKAVVAYQGMNILTPQDIDVSASPNIEPQPFLSAVNETHFVVSFNCSCGQGLQNQCNHLNYFNKVQVKIDGNISFSFLVNCDPNKRHKQFQIGYMFIALINAAIIIGVAMHSHVWSIRINHRPLRYVLYWKNFLIFSVVGIALIFFLCFFTYKDFWKAFAFIKYFGLVFSIFFVFLCFNQAFFLIKKLRRPIYKIVRLCDICSGVMTITVITIALFFDNWVLYDVIAGCICVGSIKIFHFNSLKESYLAMTIMVLTITTVSGVLHFLLPLSYNDYAGELSSPIFFEVPDMVNNLFKKCSWLPILDVIIPGVTLSYLRVHDENKSSKWGGIYTLSGNIAFVISTIIWIGIQIVDPYSCPFSLVTFPILMFVIFIISWRRNDWTTLLYGQFQQGYDVVDMESLTETRTSFSKLMPESAISETLVKDEFGSSIITN